MNRGEFGLNLLGIEGWSTKKYTDAERAKLIAQLAESERSSGGFGHTGVK